MTPAGKKPVFEKLGLQAGQRIWVDIDPGEYARRIGGVPTGVEVVPLESGELNFVHLFARSKGQLREKFARAKAKLMPDGMIWISWPKQSSSMAGDLKEGDVRSVGLELGLVDVKVVAVDEDWSGLKFVYRREDRP